jgi:hypothetical protein
MAASSVGCSWGCWRRWLGADGLELELVVALELAGGLELVEQLVGLAEVLELELEQLVALELAGGTAKRSRPRRFPGSVADFGDSRT